MQDFVVFIGHHSTLVMALVLVLGLLFILEFIKLKRGANKVTPSAAVHLMNHDKAAVVDIRNREAYLAGHIVNSISLPLNELNDKIKKIEKFKLQPILLVCATGNESSRAANQLMSQGFQVQVLSGGINAWRAADMPLVKG